MHDHPLSPCNVVGWQTVWGGFRRTKAGMECSLEEYNEELITGNNREMDLVLSRKQ
jgi:hypothetical protein